MNAFNIVVDDAEKSFMVIAMNRTLLTWMHNFLKNQSELQKYGTFVEGGCQRSISRMCVDRFVVGCYNTQTCYDLADALQRAVVDAIQRKLIPAPSEQFHSLEDAVRLLSEK